MILFFLVILGVFIYTLALYILAAYAFSKEQEIIHMKVDATTSGSYGNGYTLQSAENTLNTIARVHKIDVADMVSVARDLGDSGEEWQQRVVRLADRVERLKR